MLMPRMRSFAFGACRRLNTSICLCMCVRSGGLLGTRFVAAHLESGRGYYSVRLL